MIKAIVLAAVGLDVAEGIKLSIAASGTPFTKCIQKSDWETKTIHDDITLVDRVEGCCPTDTLPGVVHTTSYESGQIVCGFKADGSVAFTAGTSGCTYNNCFIVPLDLACVSGQQRINGCCADPDSCAGSACGFKSNCLNYAPTTNGVKYCTSYNKTYVSPGAGTEALTGTTSAADDLTGTTKLHWSKVKKYTKCGPQTGSGDGDGPAPSPAPSPGGSPSPAPSPAGDGPAPSPAGDSTEGTDTDSASKMGLASLAAAMTLAMGTLL